MFKMLSLWIEPSALNRSVIVEPFFRLPVSATRCFLFCACVLIYAIASLPYPGFLSVLKLGSA